MNHAGMAGTAGMIMGVLLAAPAFAQNPYSKPDDSWISISGTVKNPVADQFSLDYGSGTITVEMDDWDLFQEGTRLKDGDKVTVTGMVDDDLYEVAAIEANSVYIEGFNTTFFANATDEEALIYYTTPALVTVGSLVVNGTVTSTNDDGEFTIDTGEQRLTVDTGKMNYNPLDDEGVLQIDKGDRVSVGGDVEADFFEGRYLEADSIIKLQQDAN